MDPNPKELLSGLDVNEELDELLTTSDWHHPGELFQTDPAGAGSSASFSCPSAAANNRSIRSRSSSLGSDLPVSHCEIVP